MITQLNKYSLYSTFGVEDFFQLEEAISIMAPSMVEYYLSDLCAYTDESYLNKRNIERSIELDDYSLYYDYDENIYLEMSEMASNNDTGSLW